MTIIDKINKEYPEVKGLEWQDYHKKQREAAIWGAFELDKWISVKDGLPEEHEDILCLHESGVVFIGQYRKERYCMLHYSESSKGSHGAGFVNEEGLPEHVTHYQYLPKPPKDI